MPIGDKTEGEIRETRFSWEDRSILYLAAIFSLTSVGVAFNTFAIQDQHYWDITRRLESIVHEYRSEDVIGQGGVPEKFCVVNGQKAYIEIDGKPVEEYFGE